MKKIISFISIPILLLACGGGLPKNVLPAAKMEKLLWDAARGGEYLNSTVYYKYPAQNRAAVSNKVLDEVLKINNITKKQLDASLKYYKDNPQKLQLILDSINAQQTRINEEAEKQKRKLDSLKNRQDSLLHKTDSLKNPGIHAEKPSISKPATVDSLKIAPFKRELKKTIPKKKKKKKKTKAKAKSVPAI